MLISLLLPLPVLGQYQEGVQVGVNQRNQTLQPEPLAGDEQAGGIGLPYSQILRDTSPPYENLFSGVALSGRYFDKVGTGDQIFQATLFSGPVLQLPLVGRGFRPENAQLKIGEFYLDVYSVSGSLLYSDNANQTQTNQVKGWISIVRLTIEAMYQVSDHIRLGVQGNLVYLPFKSQVGVDGFGINDPLIAFQTSPLFQTQMSYEVRAAGWDVDVIDDLRVQYQQFGAIAGLAAFEGLQYDDADRIGRYAFRDLAPIAAGGAQNFNNNNGLGNGYIEARNLAGISMSRVLPTETWVELGAYRADFWYDKSRGGLLPENREIIYAIMGSERETLRFKPFVTASASTDNIEPGWEEEARAGITGPLTENMFLVADVGYLTFTGTSLQTEVGRVRIRHTINPLTYEQLELDRTTTAPEHGVANAATYQVSHFFRRDLSADLYGSVSQFKDLINTGLNGEEDRVAVRFNYDLGLRTILLLGGAYARYRYDIGELGNATEWVSQDTLIFWYSPTLRFNLSYQYTVRDSQAAGDSYKENLVILTVTKYF